MRTRKTRRLVLQVLLAALLLSACSSEESGGATSSSADRDAAAEGDDRTASDEGVTPDTITVAYLSPDIEALVEAGVVDDIAPPQEAIDALVADVNEDGGINGRTLEVRTVTFDVTKNPAGLISACAEVGQDAPNFAAFGPAFFGDGATCIAKDEGVPLLTQSGMAGTLFEEAGDNMFLFNLTFEQVQEGLVSSLEAAGALEGKTLGAVIRDEPGGREALDNGLIPALDELGHDVEVATITGGATGDPAAISAAVQRFKDADVDAVFLLANIFVTGGFLTAAEQEGLEAEFFVSDQSETNSNLVTRFGPASLLERSIGTSHRRMADGNAEDLSSHDRECVEIYADSIDDKPGTAGFNSQMAICQMFRTMVRGLRASGNNPTRASFVAALESMDDIDLGTGGKGSFGPEKHTIVDEVRMIRFDGDCDCFVADGEFQAIR